ncbi:MAG: ATP-binding protein [Myxococcaceae bacterium]
MDEPADDVVHIAWSTGRKLVRAEGACRQVLGAEADKLVGKGLDEALGIGPTQAEELDGRAREGGGPLFLRAHRGEGTGWLRISPRLRRGEAVATVLDFEAVLSGAPPLQISRLSSSLSHEMRNPLSSVKMAVQTLARNTGLSERDQRRLVIANREVRTMERMLWLLSEYGRETPAQVEAMPVRSLVQEAAALIEPELAERRVVLHVAASEEAAQARIKADAARLRPVLAQLFLNVAMGQPEGSALEVQLEAGPSGCLLRIDDPSAALPAEERAKLFEPFATMLARGAGLSLATLYRVMLAHGGTVTAEASEAGGTVYTLSFPA